MVKYSFGEIREKFIISIKKIREKDISNKLNVYLFFVDLQYMNINIYIKGSKYTINQNPTKITTTNNTKINVLILK